MRDQVHDINMGKMDSFTLQRPPPLALPPSPPPPGSTSPPCPRNSYHIYTCIHRVARFPTVVSCAGW